MPCSAVTLSLATICSIVAVALLSIAFSTDNWLNYDVKRSNIQVNDTKGNFIRWKMNLFCRCIASIYNCG